MENFIRLSLRGDMQAALDLQRWIQAGVRECHIRDVSPAPQAGQKGLELTNELIIAAINAPALLALARTIGAYLFSRPEVDIELVHSDGRRIAVNSKNVSLDKLGDFARRLSGALTTDAPSR